VAVAVLVEAVVAGRSRYARTTALPSRIQAFAFWKKLDCPLPSHLQWCRL